MPTNNAGHHVYTDIAERDAAGTPTPGDMCFVLDDEADVDNVHVDYLALCIADKNGVWREVATYADPAVIARIMEVPAGDDTPPDHIDLPIDAPQFPEPDHTPA